MLKGKLRRERKLGDSSGKGDNWDNEVPCVEEGVKSKSKLVMDLPWISLEGILTSETREKEVKKTCSINVCRCKWKTDEIVNIWFFLSSLGEMRKNVEQGAEKCM